jgi:hypothetical protein
MRRSIRDSVLGISVFVLMFGALGVLAAKRQIPNSATKSPVTPVTWSPHGAHLGCQMNMGPTGVRVWLRGFQFEVMTVDAGSPADGVLQPGDRIMGVGKAVFGDDADSRMLLGNAIGDAEATNGKLKLTIRRAGRKRRVTVPLTVTGPFSETWPYDCAKSQRILHDACVYLREAQFPDGHVVTDGGMGTFLSGLLFLASGEARFLDCARRAAYATCEMPFETMETENWAVGYGGVLLAEYHLATGDTNVLSKLQWMVDYLEQGQMQCGSWGHSSPNGAYGAMNQSGIICAMAISLAGECGLEVSRDALSRALTFYGRYAELGAVSYGDHGPGVSNPDDNGKSASTAILCGLHPDWQRASDVFSQSVAMSYWLRETGHTGGFFSMTWGPLAADRAGATAVQTFMDYQSWYYNLCRTWRGALVLLPYKEALTRFDDSSYNEFGGEFTTGGMALAFAMPHRKLRMFRTRNDSNAEGGMRNGSNAELGMRNAEWLDASTESTIREIENALNEGDPYRASEQYKAMARALGDDDPRVAALAPRFEDGVVKWHVGAGEKYYESWSTARSFGFQGWLPYVTTAKPLLGGVPALRPFLWDVLLPVAGDTPFEWDKAADADAVTGSRTFTLKSTDFTGLRIQFRAPRNSHTRIALNGVEVAEVVRGQRSGYAKIALDDSALSILRPGTNQLSLAGTSVGSGGNALDIGLDAVLREQPLPRTPVRTEEAPAIVMPPVLIATLEAARKTYASIPLEHEPNPGIPERLCVRDSLDRFRTALNSACDEMDDAALDAALRSPVAYWRFLASQTLVRQGADGQGATLAGLSDADWRVRSASCDVLGSLSGSDVDPGAAAMARLVELVADEHAWVRSRAARTLGMIGQPDAAAAAALAAAAMDPDAWVRSAALRAISKVTDDPALMLRAAAASLEIQTSSYGPARHALGLIQAHGTNDTSLIPSLVFAIDNPGQGGGSRRINTLMQTLATLDTEGTKTVPVLAKVATGGAAYDRLQGNVRKTAIDLLGAYGPRAALSVPALEAIARSEDERNTAYHELAEAALKLIATD